MLIAIVVYPGMTALDAIGPYEIFNCIPDRELRFVYKEVGPVLTDSGVLALGATHTFEETPNPDVILVPGGSTGTSAVAADGEVLAWLQRAHQTSRWTTSVCSGSIVLGAAGLLEGRAATSHWLVTSLLSQFGAIPRHDERVVRSDKILTAAGVSAGIDLALTLVGEELGRERAEVTQLLVEYDPQPPYDAGSLAKASPDIKARARKDMLALAANPRDVVSIPKILLRRWMQVLTRRVRAKAA
jgi:transcriptional regulator GlxA family with amidase domain